MSVSCSNGFLTSALHPNCHYLAGTTYQSASRHSSFVRHAVLEDFVVVVSAYLSAVATGFWVNSVLGNNLLACHFEPMNRVLGD